MSETRFTPGPWRIVRYCEDIEIANVADLLHFYGGETAEANAALIAAAPELYAALEAMVARFDEYNAHYIYDGNGVIPARPELDKARAALAKARGEVQS